MGFRQHISCGSLWNCSPVVPIARPYRKSLIHMGVSMATSGWRRKTICKNSSNVTGTPSEQLNTIHLLCARCNWNSNKLFRSCAGPLHQAFRQTIGLLCITKTTAVTTLLRSTSTACEIYWQILIHLPLNPSTGARASSELTQFVNHLSTSLLFHRLGATTKLCKDITVYISSS